MRGSSGRSRPKCAASAGPDQDRRAADGGRCRAQVTGHDGWALKVSASTGGLAAHERLQAFVYGQPAATSSRTPSASTQPDTSAPPDAAVVPGTSGNAPAAPPRLEGVRLFYASVGPNADGVAVHEANVLIPRQARFATQVITANLGDDPRNCEGADIYAEQSTNASAPPLEPSPSNSPDEPDDRSVACIVVPFPAGPVKP